MQIQKAASVPLFIYPNYQLVREWDRYIILFSQTVLPMNPCSHPSSTYPQLFERSCPSELIVVRGDQSYVLDMLLRNGRLTIGEIRDRIREFRESLGITTRRVEVAVDVLLQQKRVITTQTDAGMMVIPRF
jgi:hypothetical protein